MWLPEILPSGSFPAQKGPASQEGSCINRNRVLLKNSFEETQARPCLQRCHLVKTAETILISKENKNKRYHLLSDSCATGPESDTCGMLVFTTT